MNKIVIESDSYPHLSIDQLGLKYAPEESVVIIALHLGIVATRKDLANILLPLLQYDNDLKERFLSETLQDADFGGRWRITLEEIESQPSEVNKT